jgi:hypothetical protein
LVAGADANILKGTETVEKPGSMVMRYGHRILYDLIGSRNLTILEMDVPVVMRLDVN